MSAPQRVVIFDTETTGRWAEGGDRIVEVGAVELIGFEAVRTFHAYINPQRDVPEEVVRVHGLTGHFLADKPLFSQVCEDLLSFFGEDTLVAHNAEFDRAFLNAELARCGLPAFPKERFIDTLERAREKLRAGTRLSLDALSRQFRLDQRGFDLTARKGAGGHGALLDARMLAEIYIELIGGRVRSFDFMEEAAGQAERAIQEITRAPARQRLSAMPLLSSLEERALHEAFIGKLPGGTLWTGEAA
jgi:DNA polymerase-3 subunit epsilon